MAYFADALCTIVTVEQAISGRWWGGDASAGAGARAPSAAAGKVIRIMVLDKEAVVKDARKEILIIIAGSDARPRLDATLLFELFGC